MKRDFKIGAYHLQKNGRTEEHIKAIADCGIDFIIGMEYDKAALDLFDKYGLGAIISGAVPGWWGGFGENAGKLKETNPIEKYEERAKTFVDHPAIIGLCTGDEPSALDFPYYGKVIRHVSELFPEKIPYLNLYANYGVTADAKVSLEKQFGTPSYEEYIESYAEKVPLPYISYDNYPYSATIEGYLDNLQVVSEVCRRTDREMWVVAQVNSHVPEAWISEDQLRFQAFTAMAFGAARVTWACCSAGWWHNNLLAPDGSFTEQYDKLKKINGEMKTIAEQYDKYETRRTYVTSAGETVAADCITLDADCSLAVGEMTDGKGSALMLCPIDNGECHKITFRANANDVVIFGGEGIIPYTKYSDGTYTFPLPSSHGALVIAE